MKSSFLKYLYSMRYQILLVVSLCMLLDLMTAWNHFVIYGLVIFCVSSVSIITNNYKNRINKLAVRMSASNPLSWRVNLNGLEVGTITDSEYAAIEYKHMVHLSLFFTQTVNIIRAFFNLLGILFLEIPLLLFWCSILFAIFSPEALIKIIKSFQNASPMEIHSVVLNSLLIVSFILLAGILTFFFPGFSRLGFINKFNEAIYVDICRFCKIPTGGNIFLIRNIDSTLEIHSLSKSVL